MTTPSIGAHGTLTKMSGISSKWRFTRGNVGPTRLIEVSSPYYFFLDDSSLIKAHSYDELLHHDQMVDILRRHSSVRVFLSNAQPSISESGEKDFDFRDTGTLRIHRDVKVTLLFRIARVSVPSLWGKTLWWKFRFMVVAGVVNREFRWGFDGEHGVCPLFERFRQRTANEWITLKREEYVTDEDEEREAEEGMTLEGLGQMRAL
jgi:hypothetical protein